MVRQPFQLNVTPEEDNLIDFRFNYEGKQLEDLTFDECYYVLNMMVRFCQVMEKIVNTKINLCNQCRNFDFFPKCMPDNIEFGNAIGNDNIVKCENYKEML